jgi:alpha-L-rhamnosidase
LSGETKVEDAFLENYRLFQDLGDYPKGALPECYPSDASPGGIFIPQWTMWYILEVEEYVHKRGHEDMAEEFRKSIYDLLDFYRRYENEDGLLECLPSWNFVEWSKANEWTKDVNYPTNFLYAQALECIYRLYGDGECLRRSQAVREKAVQQSFNGRFFLDHAVRDEEGKLCIQEHSSEACQYYAILFGGIDIHSKEYQELKHLVLSVFSPNRKNAMPEIFEVNAFIGAYLRMEVLLKMEEYELVLRDIEAFFGRMEEKTGTLWEYREFKGSQDHGFASYALVVISKAQYLKWEVTEDAL